jgi:hypothetical protein
MLQLQGTALQLPHVWCHLVCTSTIFYCYFLCQFLYYYFFTLLFTFTLLCLLTYQFLFLLLLYFFYLLTNFFTLLYCGTSLAGQRPASKGRHACGRTPSAAPPPHPPHGPAPCGTHRVQPTAKSATAFVLVAVITETCPPPPAPRAGIQLDSQCAAHSHVSHRELIALNVVMFCQHLHIEGKAKQAWLAG